MNDYKESVSARNSTWKSEARGLLEKGIEFVVVHLNPEDLSSSKALAQEFDYNCIIEDKSPWRDEVIRDYPVKLPTAIGFVKRGKLTTV